MPSLPSPGSVPRGLRHHGGPVQSREAANGDHRRGGALARSKVTHSPMTEVRAICGLDEAGRGLVRAAMQY
jgi:hypothetical protein